MKTNQNNDLHRNNTAKDLSQAQDQVSNKNRPELPTESTGKATPDKEMETTQAQTTSVSEKEQDNTKQKEHDDTDHEHEYKNPAAEQRNQETNQANSTNKDSPLNREQGVSNEPGKSGI